ncbi:molecular chaperone [Chitinophaga polysaccharea]|uniref:fimbrial biogenesis chaperone n=1 Tax=Chitinophaga TaxID=79328 RepID=UPI00145506FA|nr:MULTISPECIES: molecular chaperone [Chitinophaga]NLR56823.1 molecular chaperone [Chitinophaga polysaccharea]
MRILARPDISNIGYTFRFVITAILCCYGLLTSAQGNLLVTPVRVVFEGQKRAEELNLANAGTDTARYLISFVEIRMNQNGTFDQINEPDSGQQFASKYLRFFPRSVVLGPNEAQVIKLQLTGNGELTTGEYRSHLYFRAVPGDMTSSENKPASDSNSINVKLTPVFGITIPVIIRVGETTANVQLSDLSVDLARAGSPMLGILLNRSGNASVYGDITVEHVSPQGKVTEVAMARGLAVYTPNKQRYLRLPLENKPGINYHTGKLRVAYTTKLKTATQQLAAAELVL